jgi:hypothetical protein
MTPLQSSSMPLHVSGCGAEGVALQRTFVPLQIQVPVTAQPPTPTVQVPEMRQTPPQFCCPAGQPHVPAVQIIPLPMDPHAVPSGAWPTSSHTGVSTMHREMRPNRQGTPVSHAAPGMHGEHVYGGPSERRTQVTAGTSTRGIEFVSARALSEWGPCSTLVTASVALASSLASG